jgi:hypothetical protein
VTDDKHKSGWWTDQAWPPYHPEADSR